MNRNNTITWTKRVWLVLALALGDYEAAEQWADRIERPGKRRRTT